MNAETTVQASIKACKVVRKSVKKEQHCENITNSVSTFNQLLSNISNKLGLSKAIYQK